MTRIKFCGLTRAEDVLHAAHLGVHALGFICVPASKRFVTPERARALVRLSPAFVQTVGLFQNADAETVRASIAIAGFSMLQFHGAESNDFCASFGLPFLKAIPMADAPDLLECAIAFPQAKALLLDSHSLEDPSKGGGSGKGFDYNLVPDVDGENALPLDLILAGGLNAENVTDAIRRMQPFAVDVSSGIESAPGLKDVSKMRAFVDAVRNS